MADKTSSDIIDPILLNDPLGYINKNQEIITNFCINVLTCILILVLGWIATKIVVFISKKLMNRAHVETTVSRFVANIIKYALYAFTITAALSQIGIQTASFVAIIGAASLAIGMSLQGSLSNFASGVLLLIFRPLKVGELVEAAGKTGVIEEITIFTTTMLTADNTMIVIPNSSISSGVITNFSRMDTRRVDFTFGVEYGTDLKAAKDALQSMFNADERILKDKGITIVVSSLGESSINIACKVWVKSSDYWGVYNDNLEKAVEVFNKANINIPFNTYTIINK
jgi:small conductance mechanosensitive channel